MTGFRFALLAAVSTLAVGAVAQAQSFPEGPGKAVLQDVCLQCHGAAVVTSRLRSQDEWTEVVSRMVGSGAQLTDDEYQLVIEYLTAHFGPAGQGAPSKDRPTATPEAGRDK
jgi:cytochrome c5